ncbi:hypothetical protein COCOBI_05-4050 [Coccomyxa sp. Obi]|nr:hypothetical protein COCOBI_05-4050 [Coccomyxa sp. Obi]
MSEKSTLNAYTAQFGAPTITLLAEPGPGRNKSLGLVTFISRASRTAAAQRLPSALRTRCHHCCLGHHGTITVPTALQALICSITLPNNAKGAFTQLFSPCQLYEKASTPAEPGHQNLLQNLLHWLFVPEANLSKAPLGLKQFVVQQSFQLCSALLEHRPKLYFSTSVSFCLSTVYNMAPAEGAPDEPGIDNPEQQPSGTNSELAELKRMFMDSQMESREREKRMCAALQSRNTLTEAGKLARVPPGTCYSSALVVQNCQLQKSDQ